MPRSIKLYNIYHHIRFSKIWHPNTIVTSHHQNTDRSSTKESDRSQDTTLLKTIAPSPHKKRSSFHFN